MTVVPRYSSREPVVGPDGRPTRSYSLVFDLTQHWTTQTAVLNVGVSAQVQDLANRLEDGRALTLQAQAEASVLRGDPRLANADEAYALAQLALVRSLSAQQVEATGKTDSDQKDDETKATLEEMDATFIDRARNVISAVGSIVYDPMTGEISFPVRTGWTPATGTATRTTFDTATVTLPELAERLKALLDDLTTSQIIGT